MDPGEELPGAIRGSLETVERKDLSRYLACDRSPLRRLRGALVPDDPPPERARGHRASAGTPLSLPPGARDGPELPHGHDRGMLVQKGREDGRTAAPVSGDVEEADQRDTSLVSRFERT